MTLSLVILLKYQYWVNIVSFQLETLIPSPDCEHLPSNHISIVAREAGKEKKVILSACSEEALSEGYHYIWDFGDGKQETITKHGMITDHEFKKEGFNLSSCSWGGS